jgi:hypothetical protein
VKRPCEKILQDGEERDTKKLEVERKNERREGECRKREGGKGINVRKYQRGELQARQVHKIRS